MQLTGTLSNNGYGMKRNDTNNDSNKKVISDSGLFTAGAKALSSNTEAGPSTSVKGKERTIMIPMININKEKDLSQMSESSISNSRLFTAGAKGLNNNAEAGPSTSVKGKEHTIDMIPMLSINKGKDYLSQIPDEVLSQIFGLLDLKSLLSLFQVNKRFDNLNFMHYLMSIPTEGLALGSSSRRDLIIYIKDRVKQEALELIDRLRSLLKETLVLASNNREDWIHHIKYNFKHEGLKLLKYLYVMENPNEVIKNTKFEEVVGVASTSLLDKKKTREVMLLQFLQAEFNEWALKEGITLPDFQAILDKVDKVWSKKMNSTRINMSTEPNLESLTMSFNLIKQVMELENSFNEVIKTRKLVNTANKAFTCFGTVITALLVLILISAIIVDLRAGSFQPIKPKETIAFIIVMAVAAIIFFIFNHITTRLKLPIYKGLRIFRE